MNRILAPLSEVFRWGVVLRHSAYKRSWLKTRRLHHPVISVGNLTVGGTGKTPFVAFLAELLLKRGRKPAILTRGYGRRSGASCVVLHPAPGRVVNARQVGDEPAWLAERLPCVPIVVGSDRFAAGLAAEETFKVDVHLLDDGFQHLSLARDLDIVLVDVTQSLSDATLLPAGRFREPWSALERAHWVVLTRAELGDATTFAKHAGGFNPRAKVFQSGTKLSGLREVQSDDLVDCETLRSRKVLAFCGLGNPDAFFRDLRKWGLTRLDEISFPDHHVYSARDMRRLLTRAREAGAVALVTSEKDVQNLPSIGKADIPLLACAVQTEVREAQAFEQSLFEHLEACRAGATRCASAEPS